MTEAAQPKDLPKIQTFPMNGSLKKQFEFAQCGRQRSRNVSRPDHTAQKKPAELARRGLKQPQGGRGIEGLTRCYLAIGDSILRKRNKSVCRRRRPIPFSSRINRTSLVLFGAPFGSQYRELILIPVLQFASLTLARLALSCISACTACFSLSSRLFLATRPARDMKRARSILPRGMRHNSRTRSLPPNRHSCVMKRMQ